MKKGKRYAELTKLVDRTNNYDPQEAVALVKKLANAKFDETIELFGSYGWGDGEWMRNWVEQMEGAGATVVGGEDAICQEAPDEDAQDELKAMGKQLAAI